MLYLARAFARGKHSSRVIATTRLTQCRVNCRAYWAGASLRSETFVGLRRHMQPARLQPPRGNRRRGPGLLAPRAQGAVTRTCTSTHSPFCDKGKRKPTRRRSQRVSFHIKTAPPREKLATVVSDDPSCRRHRKRTSEIAITLLCGSLNYCKYLLWTFMTRRVR